MNILRKYRLEILIFIIISILYFALRLPNLTLQPIFADEAIYIRWAQVMRAEPTLRFLPLSDGKTPLFMWLIIPLFKVFSDPLFAGRFLSVLSGFATLVGALFLGWRFFGIKTGLWSTFLIATVPFMVFFDRMALVDSMLTAFSIWSLNLALLLIKYSRIDLAMLLGYFMGASLLTKPPGFFNILALPSTLILFGWKEKLRQSKLLKLFGLWGLAVVITLVIYNILRLGPGFSNLTARNQDYIFNPVELIGRPLDPFIPHFRDIADWFPKFFTLPILILVITGIILAFLRLNKLVLTILFWSLIPLLAQMAFLKTFTARYLLFSIPPLLTLAGWTLDQLINTLPFNKRKITIMVVLALLPLATYFNFYLLTDPSKAPLPREERSGYLEAWTAGVGLSEIANFLAEQSKKEMVVVGTEGSFGTLPDGLQIYLDKNSNVVFVGGNTTVSSELREAAKKHPSFFVANKSRYKFYQEGLQLIKEYPKATDTAGQTDAILLFRVFPIKESTISASLNE